VKLEQSYLAKMGHQMEPVIAPLGYDWKMGVGIITSFAAREVLWEPWLHYTVWMTKLGREYHRKNEK
jgi:Fe2+ transport system protein B